MIDHLQVHSLQASEKDDEKKEDKAFYAQILSLFFFLCIRITFLSSSLKMI